MGLRAEQLFQRLRTREALEELIGQSEDSTLECKAWYSKPEERGGIIKAACGLANAEGGVIIIGMDARGRANEPDLIQGFAFVSHTGDVAREALRIITDGLEPGLVGVMTVGIGSTPESDSGCVVVYVPEYDGTPQRVRKGGQFYIRMATGTMPMLYSQIADRFGRRPHAKLVVEAAAPIFKPQNYYAQAMRTIVLSVRNDGRGIARFPVLFCDRRTGLFHEHGLFGAITCTWPHFNGEGEQFSYRGKTDDVIYPGEKIKVASVQQLGTSIRAGEAQPSGIVRFEPILLRTTVVCEGMPEVTQEFEWGSFTNDPNSAE